MIIEDYNYPLIVFKDGDKNIYATKNHFGIVSKGGEKFYRDLTFVDSKGHVFKLKRAKVEDQASLGVSLKYFQRMWKMELDFEDAGVISIDELKAKIMHHVSQNPKHWLVLDTLDGIKKRVDGTNNFKELILIFR